MRQKIVLKLWLALTFCVGMIHLSNAQTKWKSLGGHISGIVYGLYTDPIDSMLYAGGKFKYANGLEVNGVAAWDGLKWNALGAGQQPCSLQCKGVTSFIRYNGLLFAGGVFDSIGGIDANAIASWDGQMWSPLGAGLKKDSFNIGAVLDMAVYNDELYVAGSFNTADTVPVVNVAKWDGAQWYPVATASSPQNLTVYKGELYMADDGLFRYNGIDWDLIQDSDSVKITKSVYALTEYNGLLFAGGWFNTADGSPGNNIVAWDGTNWHTFGEGIPSGCTAFEKPVQALLNYQNKLYVGGHFFCLDGVSSYWLAQYDGEAWCGNQSEFSTTWPGITNEGIYKMAGYKGSLVVGGLFGELEDTMRGFLAALPDADNLCETVGVAEIPNDSGMVSIIPNPLIDQSTLILPQNYEQAYPLSFELYNLQGAMVLQIQNVRSNKLLLHKGNLNTGFYFYQLKSKDHSISTGKICIQ